MAANGHKPAICRPWLVRFGNVGVDFGIRAEGQHAAKLHDPGQEQFGSVLDPNDRLSCLDKLAYIFIDRRDETLDGGYQECVEVRELNTLNIPVERCSFELDQRFDVVDAQAADSRVEDFVLEI